MNIFIMSRPSPGPARPAHTRPRPGPSPMCLNCFQARPGPGQQYVGPGPARPAKLCRGPARPGPARPGPARPGPRRALVFIQSYKVYRFGGRTTTLSSILHYLPLYCVQAKIYRQTAIPRVQLKLLISNPNI